MVEMALNEVGIYTKKQYKELDERNCKLWDALNECVSFMSVYSSVIKEMTSDELRSYGPFGTRESRMDYICQICDKMAELKEKTRETMFKAGRSEFL